MTLLIAGQKLFPTSYRYNMVLSIDPVEVADPLHRPETEHEASHSHTWSRHRSESPMQDLALTYDRFRGALLYNFWFCLACPIRKLWVAKIDSSMVVTVDWVVWSVIQPREGHESCIRVPMGDTD
jgi:hypothetical protein